MYFAENIFLIFWIFGIWYTIGLGFLLILLPKSYRPEAFTLAPLLGLALLVLAGLFQITVLLSPLYPKTNAAILAAVSISIIMWKWRSLFLPTWQRIYRHLVWLSLAPLALLIAFAFLFHQNGYYLLVGGSDQLQYCLNAKQIANEMHTGSKLDFPIARQDHYTQEMCTRTLPYLKSYRRGAEVMLATTTQLTNLNVEEAFPLSVICVLLTLGFALAFVARIFFHISLLGTLVLQATFLSSFYFLLLHIQGSLALIMSIPFLFITLCSLVSVARKNSWRWFIFSGIFLAAYLSIYSEPALVNIFLPTMILIGRQFFQSTTKGIRALGRFILVFGLASLLAPYAIYLMITNASNNLTLLAHHQEAPVILKMLMQPWTVAPVLLGGASYYDNSSFNNMVASYFAQFPWLGAICFVVLSLFGLLGYLSRRNPFAYLFAFVLIMWSASSWVLLYLQDILRFVRSLQYSMPFIMLGLVLLATKPKNIQAANKSPSIILWLGRCLIVLFVAINIATDQRVGHFLLKYSISNDPILLRLKERSEPWRELKEELHYSAVHQVPVLISSFKETIRPLAIAGLLGEQTHVLGTSMAFWPIYSREGRMKWKDFNTRNTEQDFNDVFQSEDKDWDVVLSNLISHSEQAVVPAGSNYPEEWIKDKDIYTPTVKHFGNICDVVYRKKFAVTLEEKTVSNLKRDNIGLYRIVKTSGSVLIKELNKMPATLELVYDGKVNDLKLKINNQYYSGTKTKRKYVTITAQIFPNEARKINLIVLHPVKLRSISWIS